MHRLLLPILMGAAAAGYSPGAVPSTPAAVSTPYYVWPLSVRLRTSQGSGCCLRQAACNNRQLPIGNVYAERDRFMCVGPN
jgi:hypothetical protein